MSRYKLLPAVVLVVFVLIGASVTEARRGVAVYSAGGAATIGADAIWPFGPGGATTRQIVTIGRGAGGACLVTGPARRVACVPFGADAGTDPLPAGDPLVADVVDVLVGHVGDDPGCAACV